MSLDLVDKIAEEASRKSEFVTLHAWGESIFHPSFHTAIRTFKSKGCATPMFTNATLLNEERQERLLHSGLDILVLGIDATEEQTCNQLRSGGDFRTTVRNAERFISEVRTRGFPMFCVAQLVYTNTNKREIRMFTECWRARRAHVWLKPYRTRNGEDPLLGNHDPHDTKQYHDSLCDWPWRQFVIHCDSSAVPCCNDFNGALRLGNVTEATIEQIWNGPEMKAFRKPHVKGRPRCSSAC